MNRLEFSEGGQPVYLDDLERLQSNMVKLILALFPQTEGASQPTSSHEKIKDVTKCTYFATPRTVNGSSDANFEWMQAHLLLSTDGKVYTVAETHFGDYDGLPIDGYYVLTESTAESRTFEDGLARAVVKSYTATIVPEKPTSGTWIAVKDVPSLDQLQAVLPAAEYVQDYWKTE